MRLKKNLIKAIAIAVVCMAGTLTSYAGDAVDTSLKIVEAPTDMILLTGATSEKPTVAQALAAIEEAEAIKAFAAAQASEPKLGESLGNFRLTGYCPCRKCNGNNPPVTRMGTPLIPGQTIAVDRRVIPLGTWVYLNLPGQGWTKFRAEDTGSAIKGNRIDVLRPTHEECFSALWNSTVEVRLALD